MTTTTMTMTPLLCLLALVLAARAQDAGSPCRIIGNSRPQPGQLCVSVAWVQSQAARYAPSIVNRVWVDFPSMTPYGYDTDLRRSGSGEIPLDACKTRCERKHWCHSVTWRAVPSAEARRRGGVFDDDWVTMPRSNWTNGMCFVGRQTAAHAPLTLEPMRLTVYAELQHWRENRGHDLEPDVFSASTNHDRRAVVHFAGACQRLCRETHGCSHAVYNSRLRRPLCRHHQMQTRPWFVRPAVLRQDPYAAGYVPHHVDERLFFLRVPKAMISTTVEDHNTCGTAVRTETHITERCLSLCLLDAQCVSVAVFLESKNVYGLTVFRKCVFHRISPFEKPNCIYSSEFSSVYIKLSAATYNGTVPTPAPAPAGLAHPLLGGRRTHGQ